MQLQSCKKAYSRETHRAVAPEVTLANFEPKVPATGITRVADITNLDRIGIPVFSCIRPTAADGAISIYNGKGATPTEARVSAIMEGIERYSAELGDREIIMGEYSRIRREENALNPGDLILPEQGNPEMYLPWFRGWDIAKEEEIYVPAHAVFHPFPRGYLPPFRTNTNGLASGNTPEEAIFHGLAEVVERDAWSLAEATRETGPRIRTISDPLGSELLKKFTDAEVEIGLKNITSDLGVPTIAAVADDVRLRDPTLLTIGMGTHTSARIALLRALTEVAQSRLTQIHGAREDATIADFRKKMGYERTKRMNRYWFDARAELEFGAIPSFDSDDFLTDIRFVTGRIRQAGLERVIVCNLTRPELGVPVVRVIVPGLEVFAMDGERMGERCRNARRNHSVSRPKP
jgi:ribosomal protein S12 methylthiotransferase accessory factor